MGKLTSIMSLLIKSLVEFEPSCMPKFTPDFTQLCTNYETNGDYKKLQYTV